jgi:ATP-dependent exoDNAse (exonuclease V) alpha subunit
LIAALELEGLNVAVLATTGSAAHLICGQTIHKFFGIDINNTCWLEKGTRDYVKVSSTDVFVIDEISMMSQIYWN